MSIIYKAFYNVSMLNDQIENYLRAITPSEQYHIEHPGVLSKRYELIPKIIDGGKELYLFGFDSLLKERNISITKESRFTWIPLHKHKVIELNYIYSGTCTQIIEGKKVVLKQGDVILLNRNVRHELCYMDKNDIVITIDMRKSYLLDTILTRISSQGIVAGFVSNAIRDDTNVKQYILFHPDSETGLKNSIENIFLETLNSDVSNEIIDAYMTIIFTQLLRIYRKGNSQHTEDSSSLILDLLQYMENNYLTVSLNDLSEEFGYNPNYLGNYIKEQTGRTFKDLVIAKKMSNAAYYLVNTEMPIYEIASLCGYENLGFFYEKFARIYQMKPQEYRNIYRTKNEFF